MRRGECQFLDWTAFCNRLSTPAVGELAWLRDVFLMACERMFRRMWPHSSAMQIRRQASASSALVFAAICFAACIEGVNLAARGSDACIRQRDRKIMVEQVFQIALLTFLRCHERALIGTILETAGALPGEGYLEQPSDLHSFFGELRLGRRLSAKGSPKAKQIVEAPGPQLAGAWAGQASRCGGGMRATCERETGVT